MDWTTANAARLRLCAAILAAGLAILLAFPANGQGTPSSDDDPPPVPLAEGEPAPYEGDLWPVRRSLRMALRAEACEARAAATLTHETRRFQIELDYERKAAAIQRAADQRRIEVLLAALDDANPWYRSPAFVATVTAVVTLAAVLVSAILIEAALSPFAVDLGT